MSIDKTEIDTIARLARLHLDPADTRRYMADLNRILELVQQLAAVDTTGIVPMAHPLDINARLREDVVTEEDQRDHFQQDAPQVQDGYYLVPRVIE